MSDKVSRFRQDKLPKQVGEIARLRVKSGPDSGTSFVIKNLPITLGRGEENEVMLADLRTSRKHALLGKDPQGRWFVQDIGSPNKIECDGKVDKYFNLKHGSVFKLGETQIEFGFAELWADLQPKKAGAKQQNLPATVNPLTGLPFARNTGGAAAVPAIPSPPRVAAYTPPPAGAVRRSAGKSNGFEFSLGGGSDPNAAAKKRILVIVGAVVLGSAYTVIETSSVEFSLSPFKFVVKPKEAPKKEEKKGRSLASLLPPSVNSDRVNAADTLYKSGYREYREHNFLRAKTLFETVLQVDPAHVLAQTYLENTENQIREEVKFHLATARRDLNNGKYRSAKAHYEAVTRLLYRSQSAPEFVEAKDQLDSVTKKIKGGSS